jgi:hypothetical protein
VTDESCLPGASPHHHHQRVTARHITSSVFTPHATRPSSNCPHLPRTPFRRRNVTPAASLHPCSSNPPRRSPPSLCGKTFASVTLSPQPLLPPHTFLPHCCSPVPGASFLQLQSHSPLNCLLTTAPSTPSVPQLAVTFLHRFKIQSPLLRHSTLVGESVRPLLTFL